MGYDNADKVGAENSVKMTSDGLKRLDIQSDTEENNED